MKNKDDPFELLTVSLVTYLRMIDMSVTDTVAWWGAIVATLVFLWDVYKWRKAGVLVVVRANPNMQPLNQLQGRLDPHTIIFIEAVNRGHRATTVTHLMGYHYKSLLRLILRKHDNMFIVPNTGLGPPLPHTLQPGDRWTGGISQKCIIEKIGTDGYLYCGVIHATADKPVLVKVKLKKLKVP